MRPRLFEWKDWAMRYLQHHCRAAGRADVKGTAHRHSTGVPPTHVYSTYRTSMWNLTCAVWPPPLSLGGDGTRRFQVPAGCGATLDAMSSRNGRTAVMMNGAVMGGCKIFSGLLYSARTPDGAARCYSVTGHSVARARRLPRSAVAISPVAR